MGGKRSMSKIRKSKSRKAYSKGLGGPILCARGDPDPGERSVNCSAWHFTCVAFCPPWPPFKTILGQKVAQVVFGLRDVQDASCRSPAAPLPPCMQMTLLYDQNYQFFAAHTFLDVLGPETAPGRPKTEGNQHRTNKISTKNINETHRRKHTP